MNHIHQEEDAAKITHLENSSEIDYNRASTPLMELVTEPDMSSPDEAIAFLTALKEMLVYAGISDCNLELGHVRCDVNSSVRPAGTDKLGVKCEIKNMNTFKGIHRALEYELERQVETLRAGGKLVQETRRWDDVARRDPADALEGIRPRLPLFPGTRPAAGDAGRGDGGSVARGTAGTAGGEARAVRPRLRPTEYDAGVLTADPAIAGYFEAAAQKSKNYKAVSNWTMGELLRALGEKGETIADAKISPEALAALIALVDAKTINMPAAKEVFQILFDRGGDPAAIVKEKGLAQVSDTGAIDGFAEQAISANEKVAAESAAARKRR